MMATLAVDHFLLLYPARQQHRAHAGAHEDTRAEEHASSSNTGTRRPGRRNRRRGDAEEENVEEDTDEEEEEELDGEDTSPTPDANGAHTEGGPGEIEMLSYPRTDPASADGQVFASVPLFCFPLADSLVGARAPRVGARSQSARFADHTRLRTGSASVPPTRAEEPAPPRAVCVRAGQAAISAVHPHGRHRRTPLLRRHSGMAPGLGARGICRRACHLRRSRRWHSNASPRHA